MPDVGHRVAGRDRPAPRALPATRRRKEARGMAEAELRIGVIGAGRWANMAHLPGWKRDPRCELVAVCDVDRALADNAAQEYGIPTAATDARDLLADEDIGDSGVVTGDHASCLRTRGAVERGTHRLVDEPGADEV